MHARSLAISLLVLSLTGLLSPAFAQVSIPGVHSAQSCPVTFQPALLDDPPMGWGSYATAYGSENLRVTLPTGGVLIATNKLVNDDGEIWDKFLFWGSNSAGNPLEISGERIDAPAPPLRVEVAEGSGGLGAGLFFPTTGCWDVTATHGDDSVSFTLLVTRVYEVPEDAATPFAR